MKVAVVGATGLVGRVMLQVLEERNFPVSELLPVASERSVGTSILWKGNKYIVLSMREGIEKKPDIALFSAGGDTSLKWAPEFAKAGTIVIDNSSAWRMNPNHPLIVPEVNAHVLKAEDRIIANPNCSTIQLVVALAPLHRKYGLKRVVISTYQSITGTGKAAVEQLENEAKGNHEADKMYPHQIFENALPQCDVFEEGGYTKEELKMIRETQKILEDRSIAVTATAVRLPIKGGHSESVNIEFERDFDEDELRTLLRNSPGITIQDNPEKNEYPMPLYAHEKDDVFVGRIRRDLSQPKSVNLWIVSDNLRKGAATNAVQIAEQLIKQGFVCVSAELNA